MKSLIYRAASQEILLGRARSNVANGITALMYHDIGPDDDDADAWQVVRQRDFLAQVAYLRRHYEIIDLDTAVELVASEVQLKKPAAVLTFDDALKGNHRHLFPLVKQHKIPVTIYVATQQVEQQSNFWFDRVVNALNVRSAVTVNLGEWGLGEFDVRKPRGPKRWADIQRILLATKNVSEREAVNVAASIEAQVAHMGLPAPGRAALAPMTIAELQEMAANPLVTIGSHTHGHELLPNIPIDEARRSIVRSCERLKTWTGVLPRHFAFPAGRSDEATRELVADLGFTTCVGTDTGIWTRDADTMNIPRISVGRYDSLDVFKVNALSGLRDLFRATMF